MTRKNLRNLIFTQVGTFSTTLAGVYYENLEGPKDKGDKYIKALIRFGSSTAVSFGQSRDIGILLVQVFYKKDKGGSVKDDIVDELASLFNYKTFTDSNGLVQFRGGTEVSAPNHGEYLQVQYSIPFGHYKEIA